MGMILRLAILLLWTITVRQAFATHIIGGELYYEHLGGSQYQIHLNLFRDCGPTNTLGTGFDANASIGVFDQNNTFLFTLSLPLPPGGEQIVPWVINNPCLLAPPSICVATITYTGQATLPPITGGYTLSYQRCCRTPAIVNLIGANNQGITCMVKVPGTPNASNSAPSFDEYPPIVLCLGESMVIDHSATDLDGDQLEYELYTPFTGGSTAIPAPDPPTAPPYQAVIWSMGYSAGYPIDSDPAINIDPITGLLTLTPSLQGSFAVGVKVKEFRNGVLLSEVIRDFKFDVVSCEMNTISAIQEQDPNDLCNGLSVDFVNESLNALFFHWDFGDPSTDADTSSLAEPSWIYTQGGSFVVTLIANPGWPCADTNQTVFHTSQPLEISFQQPPVACVDEVVTLQALGNFPANSAFTWSIPPAGAAQNFHEQLLPVSFNSVGTHPVTVTVNVDECFETYTDSVIVMPFPEAAFTSESMACVGAWFAFEDLSTAATPLNYLWDLGDGTTSSAQHPVHQYQDPGSYTVTLIVNTTNGCVAADSLTLVDQVEVYPLPVAGFDVDPAELSMINARVEVTDRSQGAVQWTYHVEDQVIHDPNFVHWFDDAGQVTIWQTVVSPHGCVDTTSRAVWITDHLFFAPNTFTPNGDGLNDSFAPVVKGARLYDLRIYDRYGAEVFNTREPKGEWAGDEMPEGVYQYVARIGEHGPYRKEYRGHITLVR